MTNWSIHVEGDFGFARIVLTGDGKPVGVATMPYGEYVAIWRRLVSLALTTSRDATAQVLRERLYHDAVTIFGLSPETAAAKLQEFGWSEEKIALYAGEISMKIAEKIAEMMPGGGR
jgi:hypothetical protein